MRRRRLLQGVQMLALAPVAAALSAVAVRAQGAHEGRVQLPLPESLADVLARALARQQPLVVMVSLPGCPYCRMVRDSYLGPLSQEVGLPVVQIDMGSRRPVLGFDRQPTHHDAVVRAWGVRVAPTVLFIGPGGAELAPRIAGAGVPDFYGAYLEQRLAQARATLARSN